MPPRIKRVAKSVVNYFKEPLVAKVARRAEKVANEPLEPAAYKIVRQGEYVRNNYTAEEWFTTPLVTKIYRGINGVTNKTEARTEAAAVMNESMGFQRSENRFIPRSERTDR